MIEKKLKVANALIGSDPELFLYSQEKQKFVPVCGLIGGTKDKPIPVAEGFGLQEDNVMLEYTISPAKTREEFLKNINFAKDYIRETILTPKGLIPKYQASAEFDFDDLQTPAALMFGCSPDYNAWTLEQNEFVHHPNTLLRTSGMHIHIGYDNPDFDLNTDLVKAFDLFVTIPSLLLDPDTERRKVYGKAGAYRMKSYGVEARQLSGFFQQDDAHIKWVYDNTIAAIDFVNIGGIITNPEQIIEAINTCNKDLALEIIEDYKINVLDYAIAEGK
mgnify:CR=1 FL=1